MIDAECLRRIKQKIRMSTVTTTTSGTLVLSVYEKVSDTHPKRIDCEMKPVKYFDVQLQEGNTTRPLYYSYETETLNVLLKVKLQI